MTAGAGGGAATAAGIIGCRTVWLTLTGADGRITVAGLAAMVDTTLGATAAGRITCGAGAD